MKKEDLTQVKYVGASRMKVLHDSGIKTIKQLSETPLEKLSQLESFGAHYAKLIKDAVAEFQRKVPKKIVTKTEPAKEKKIEEINRNLQKQIKTLQKRLKQAGEDLKPLGKKKYLESYLELKKRSKTLKARLNELDQITGNLSKKVTKNIMKKADALSAVLQGAGKKPKMKKYKKISQEIQSFSKMLKKTRS